MRRLRRGTPGRASEATPFTALIDPDAPEFMAPGDIPTRISGFCARTGRPRPSTQGETVRCILESLAPAHRRTLHDAARVGLG
ncbi:FGGY-family carbohydrate kinase [Streptomyces sp. NPDC050529]|uniref:FGGY-family carbohydrate kinase n=1 Tax=Streptomyces sp. NPDC050529 TaxID=3365624 RepID=UPI0037ADD56F